MGLTARATGVGFYRHAHGQHRANFGHLFLGRIGLFVLYQSAPVDVHGPTQRLDSGGHHAVVGLVGYSTVLQGSFVATRKTASALEPVSGASQVGFGAL